MMDGSLTSTAIFLSTLVEKSAFIADENFDYFIFLLTLVLFLFCQFFLSLFLFSYADNKSKSFELRAESSSFNEIQ